MRIFWKIPISALPAFIFQWVFISRSCFESDAFIAYTNEWDLREKTMFIHTYLPLITSFYIKNYLFFADLAISQRWSAIFCATGEWGGNWSSAWGLKSTVTNIEPAWEDILSTIKFDSVQFLPYLFNFFGIWSTIKIFWKIW